MMSDIVERLRYQRTNSVICNEAATEIERLRKESFVWEMAARELAKELGKEEYADAAYQDGYDIFEDNRNVRHD
jgi:hypothetical protein